MYVFYGNFFLTIRRCMFRENVAYVSGGAIAIMGTELSTFLLVDSVFDANAVRTPPDAGGVEVTLRINTGGFALSLIHI